MTSLFLQRDNFQILLDVIKDRGYQVYGPQVADGSIVFKLLNGLKQLPEGMIDHQQPGEYRLEKTGSKRWFSSTHGPQALKPLLFKPREYLWQAGLDKEGQVHFCTTQQTEPSIAVLGVRACDLAALRLHDQHFLEESYPDPFYSQRRAKLFIIAVDCHRSTQTCFCASTGDGPAAKSEFDICLSELDEGFLVRTGTVKGQNIIAQLSLPPADPSQLEQAQNDIQTAGTTQQRKLPVDASSQALENALDKPNWDTIAERCLACGNCTSVCPTCFCHHERDETSVDGKISKRYRQWSSCFTTEHSYMHGLVVRANTALRYRQWFTHKLSGWHKQYGRSGCVGCGRCISWCPVGIDITAEAIALYQN